MMADFTQWVQRRRIILLISSLFLTFILAFSLRSYYIGDHDTHWIKGSKEYVKLQNMQQNEVFVKKVIFPVSLEDLTRDEFEELENIYSYLNNKEEIFKINSLFTYAFPVKFVDEDSSFTQMVTLSDSQEQDRYSFFKKNIQKFKQFNNSEKERICFYLLSKEKNHIEKIPTNLPYHITNPKKKKNEIEEIKLLLGLGITLFVILLLAFKNFSAPLTAIIFVAVTMVWTTVLFGWIMGGATPHISILILSFCVSLIDYIYIYYNWYISHKYYDKSEVLVKTIDRTFVPILLTTLINSIGFALLLFSDSYMLQSLSIMVIIASFIGLILNFTLLPAMLSFFTINSPSLLSEKISGFLTRKIRYYNPTVVKLFFAVIAIFGIYVIANLYQSSYYVKTAQSSRLIKVLVNQSELTATSLQEIENLLKTIEPSDDVVKVDSVYHAVKAFHKAQSNTPFILENIDVDHYSFMFDLSGGIDKYIEEGKLIVDIHSKNLESKKRILNKLRKSTIPVVVKDMDSLLQSAKLDTIKVMIILILFMIAVVSIIVMLLTKKTAYLVITLIVNVIPLVLFFTLVYFLSLPITPEIFISMIIAIAIANDATIHFIYYHHRFCGSFTATGRTGIYELFTFVGSPLLLGNIILAFVFLLLVFTHIPSITAIGLFSAILVLLSILTDIFIMPILFLKLIAKK